MAFDGVGMLWLVIVALAGASAYLVAVLIRHRSPYRNLVG